MQNAEESKEKEQKKAQENRSKNYKAINDQQLSIIIGKWKLTDCSWIYNIKDILRFKRKSN